MRFSTIDRIAAANLSALALYQAGQTPSPHALLSRIGLSDMNLASNVIAVSEVADMNLDPPGPDHILLVAVEQQATHKPSKSRREIKQAIRTLRDSGYQIEDALCDRDRVPILVVFSRYDVSDQDSRAEFLWGGEIIKLKFSSPRDIMRVKAIISSGFYEESMLVDASSHYKHNNIIDVGAHIGNHSVFFGKMSAGHGMTFAFEPLLLNFRLLCENIRENKISDNVIPIQTAVGANTGNVEMTAGTSTNLGNARIVGFSKTRDGPPVKRLDDLIPLGAVIDIVKIDVEGYETEVVSGGLRVLTENDAVLYVEAKADAEKFRLDEALAPLGYVSTARFNATPTYRYDKMPS